MESNDNESARYKPVIEDESVMSGMGNVGESQKGEFIFGLDRAATEEAIIRSFRLREEKVRRREGEVREVWSFFFVFVEYDE